MIFNGCLPHKEREKRYIYLLMEVYNAISKTGVKKIKPESDKKNGDQLIENTRLEYQAKQYQQNLDCDALRDKLTAFINKKISRKKIKERWKY